VEKRSFALRKLSAYIRTPKERRNIMQNNFAPQRIAVNEHGCWAEYAEAQLLAIEGNRLIAQEIAEGIHGLWRRVMRSLDVGQRRHLPPI
jgi:hypothetical protein